jgi:hypothetical protein
MLVSSGELSTKTSGYKIIDMELQDGKAKK